MKKYYGIFAFLFFLTLFFGASVETQAASQQCLKVNTTYTRKLTGTANHKIKYTQTKNGRYYRDFKLTIDKKTVKTFAGKKYEAISYNVYLFNVAKNRTLVAIAAHSDSNLMPFMNLYEYKNKKLVYMENFCSLTRAKDYEKADKLLTPWARCKVKAVLTNKIYLSWTDQTPATGNVVMNIAYTISGSKVKRVGYSSELRLSVANQNHPRWTVNRTIKGRSVLLSQNYDFRVDAGDKVTLFAMTIQSGRRYLLLVNDNGEKGWITVPFFFDDDRLIKIDGNGNIIWGYFNECKFVG